MNRTYELMFIVRPDMVEAELDKLISTLESQVATSGGTVKSVERMGKRRLAYTVRRFRTVCTYCSRQRVAARSSTN